MSLAHSGQKDRLQASESQNTKSSQAEPGQPEVVLLQALQADTSLHLSQKLSLQTPQENKLWHPQQLSPQPIHVFMTAQVSQHKSRQKSQ